MSDNDSESSKKRTREGEAIQSSVVLSHQRPIEILDGNDISKQKVTDLQSQFDMATNANAGQEIGSHLSYLNASALDYVSLLLRMHHKKYPGQFEGLVYAEAADFRKWPSKIFFELLKKAIPEDNSTAMSLTVSDQFMKHQLVFDVAAGLDAPLKFIRLNLDTKRTYATEIVGKEEPIQKIIVDQIVTKTKPQQRFKKLVQTAIPKPVSIEDTLEVIGEKAQFMCQTYTEATSWGMVFPKEKWDDDYPDSGKSERLTQRKTDQRKFGLCNGCGSNHTLGRECLLLGHPDYNHSSQPWKDSASGKAWAERNFSNLPWKKTLDGKGWNCPQSVEEHFTGKK